MAGLRWVTGILPWVRKGPAGTICASSIPARDKCPAGLAMWWNKGSSSTDFSLWGLVVRKLARKGARVFEGARFVEGARKCLAAIVGSLAALICGLDVGGENPQTEVCATWRCAAWFGLLLIFAVPASATTYFVAAAGSDSSGGTSSGAPWQTIAKVNGSTFSPGDSILFNR